MTATVTYHPRLAQGCDHINEMARRDNIERERAELLSSSYFILLAPTAYAESDVLVAWKYYAENADGWADVARKIIDKPAGFSDAVLREVCCIYMNLDGTGVHYLRAQQHIEAINKRDFIARNCPPQETPEDVLMGMRDRWESMLPWIAAVVVALLAGTGWL